MALGFKLDPGENVIKRINHHWIDIASYTALAAFMIMAALALTYAYARYRDLFPPVIPASLIMTLVVVFICLAGLILVFGSWIYQHNYVLLTTQHIIQVEQRGLFTSQVDQVSLGRIQDVSGMRPGVLGTMFNYGRVVVQSAGEARQFIFDRVPDPQGLADYCLELHEDFMKKNPGQSGGE